VVQSIEASIRTYIVEEFLLGLDEGFTNDSPLITDGIVDSMGIMEIVDFIEEEFEIRLDQSELTLANLGSVAAMGAFVAGKLGERPSPVAHAGC
jgi:acyl carrier protein